MFACMTLAIRVCVYDPISSNKRSLWVGLPIRLVPNTSLIMHVQALDERMETLDFVRRLIYRLNKVAERTGLFTELQF